VAQAFRPASVSAPRIIAAPTAMTRRSLRRAPSAAILALGIILCVALSTAADDRFTTSDGARVHYQVVGAGRQSLVFVHGWVCDGSFWASQIGAVLAEQWRAIAVDLPGFGRSDHPEAAYTPERLARGVAAVLRQEHITDPVLVGHSMGGLVVRYVAEDFPETRGVVVVDSRSVLYGEGTIDKAQQIAFAETLRRDRTDATVLSRVNDYFVPSSPPMLRASLMAKMLRTDRSAAASAFEGMASARRWSASPTNIPTLAIYGKFATADTEPLLRRLFTRLEYGHWQEPVGHFVMMEQPERFNAALLHFLSRLPRQPR
jgi:pimeloyl-ACP methyl ester carboxylesterase